jgi:hypothetical protein
MSQDLWAATRPESAKSSWRLTAVIAIAIGVSFVLALTVAWTGNAETHARSEIGTALIAALAGLALISRYSVGKETYYFLMGVGFLGVASLDLFHAIVSMPSASDSFSLQAPVIELSWYSSRLFLAASAAVTCFAITRSAPSKALRPRNIALIAAGWIAAMAAGSLLLGAPALENEALGIKRPADALIGLLFLFAFVMFARNGMGGLGSVYSWVTISLMVNAAAELLFMAHSSETLDVYYSVSHLLKLFAYVLISVGVTVDAQRSFQLEKKVSAELGRVNNALNERNLDLTVARNDLDSLFVLASLATASIGIGDQFAEFAQELRKRVPSDRILALSVSDDLSMCRVEAAWGVELPGRQVGASMATDVTPVGGVFRSGETVTLDEESIQRAAFADNRMKPDFDAGFKSWISTPVFAKGRVIGALMARSKRANVYGEHEIKFLEQVAGLIAGPLSVSRLADSFHGSSAGQMIA